MDWVVAAIKANGGSSSPIEVSKYIWAEHEQDLRASGDLFYTWQYDLRWAAQKLRDSGVLEVKDGRRTGGWHLAESPDST